MLASALIAALRLHSHVLRKARRGLDRDTLVHRQDATSKCAQHLVLKPAPKRRSLDRVPTLHQPHASINLQKRNRTDREIHHGLVSKPLRDLRITAIPAQSWQLACT